MLDAEDRAGHGPVFGGRYEVGGLLGVGATARVYRGRDRRLDRTVAIKVFNRDAVLVEQRRRLREAGIHGSVDHPGIVGLLDSGAEDGRSYLVMEFVAGQNLSQRLLTGPMPAGEVAAMAARLADALAHLHASGVTHRDLKPANILLGEHGPLIADFGIAHALDVTRVTETGTVVGTAAYMAPEQVVGDPVGPPADVYSLGLILLECLTGRLEYPGTMVEAAVARLTRPPRIPAEVPAALADLIRRMTAHEPAARPSAAAVHTELTQRAAVVAPPTAEPLPAVAAARPDQAVVAAKPRHRKAKRAAAVVALALGAAAITLSFPFTTPQAAPPAAGSQPPPTPVSVPHTAAATLRAVEQPATQAARQPPVPAQHQPEHGPDHEPQKDKHPGKGNGKPEHR